MGHGASSFLPPQGDDLIAQQGGVFKLQHFAGFLHFLLQTADGGLPLGIRQLAAAGLLLLLGVLGIVMLVISILLLIYLYRTAKLFALLHGTQPA